MISKQIVNITPKQLVENNPDCKINWLAARKLVETAIRRRVEPIANRIVMFVIAEAAQCNQYGISWRILPWREAPQVKSVKKKVFVWVESIALKLTCNNIVDSRLKQRAWDMADDCWDMADDWTNRSSTHGEVDLYVSEQIREGD